MTDIRFDYALTPESHKILHDRFQTLVQKAAAAGIHLTADGHFTGNAEGSLRIAHDKIHVEITDKPFFVSSNKIVEGVTELLDELLGA